ncbi:DUF4123 domain-containing protein [Rugamonas sp. FT82W]|uniref:DUF4123 domain-containing protein n=1 Tax=Duganella vulcania TaxID=2692166 RepID=A0A845GDF8_9BURK|nr:DUF4123 domain-containing protein [Duganella vulcania]MYM91216.1 DUF4123 domain-containing protein [Duganella vulcania]
MEDWEPRLQTLHRLFYESAGDSCLLWVNPAQGDPFAGNALVEERKVRVPIAHPRFDLKFAPYLVPLELRRHADDDVFKSSVQMAWDAWSMENLQAANGQPIAGWVIADIAPSSLARHWASNCHLHVDKQLHKLLRFHDPGVREWLWRALSPAQQLQLLGPARTLIGFDRNRQLMYHECDAAQGGSGVMGKLALSPLLWEQIDDYATVHAAWLTVVPMLEGDRSVREREVFMALKQATQYGIRDPQDRAVFAGHALQIGYDFHRDDRLQAVWTLTRDGDFYGGALEEVTGQAVDRLAEYLGRTA